MTTRMSNKKTGAASLSTLFDFYREMGKHNLQMIFEGEFNQDVTKYVLNVTEKSFDLEGIDSSVKKKVFNVMIESLQNICKHQYSAMHKNSPDFLPAIFMIGMKDMDYFIITGNLVANEAVPGLKEKIDSINSQDKEGLKQLYKEARLRSKISDVGGAGLGLIDMARKSGNKLVYRFDPADQAVSFFSLMTNISSKKEE